MSLYLLPFFCFKDSQLFYYVANATPKHPKWLVYENNLRL